MQNGDGKSRHPVLWQTVDLAMSWNRLVVARRVLLDNPSKQGVRQCSHIFIAEYDKGKRYSRNLWNKKPGSCNFRKFLQTASTSPAVCRLLTRRSIYNLKAVLWAKWRLFLICSLIYWVTSGSPFATADGVHYSKPVFFKKTPSSRD